MVYGKRRYWACQRARIHLKVTVLEENYILMTRLPNLLVPQDEWLVFHQAASERWETIMADLDHDS